MLSIKPIIEVRDGVVEEAGQGPHPLKASHLSPRKPRPAVDSQQVFVFHGQAPDVEEFLDCSCPRACPATRSSAGVVGPVIGTHAGPRVIGIGWIQVV